MKILSSLFLVLSLCLCLLFGAQSEAWSWGPAMLALACSILFSLGGKPPAERAGLLWVSLVLAAAWIGLRAIQSPVIDFARADIMLVLCLVATAWVVGGFERGGREIRILHVGLACVVIANLIMAAIQWRHPEVTWPYAHRPTSSPTGFFGHRNYFANFVVGGSLLLLGRAFFSGDRIWQRILYGLSYAGVLVMIWPCGSRGGLIAFGVGTLLVLVASAVIAWRTKSRWLPAALIALLAVLIALPAISWVGLKHFQENRNQEADVTAVADNSARLEWIQLAMEVIGDHPVSGGGSRCFSWEYHTKWSLEEFGVGYERPQFVHNELLQLGTDYGLVGVVLVGLGLLLLAGAIVVGLIVGHGDREIDKQTVPIFVGLAGAGGAVLFQANLSFVFHLLPAVMLLGIFFGLGISARREARPAGQASRWIWKGLGLALLPVLLYFAWMGSVTLRWVWPVIYAEPSLAVTNPEEGMHRLEKASETWKGYRIYEEQGNRARLVAKQGNPADGHATKWNELAAAAYRRAIEAHPYHPGLAVNLANTCSDLGLNEEAEQQFERALILQGGLEGAFRAKYYLARHLYALWGERWIKERRAEEALAQFKRAAALLEEAEATVPWVIRNEIRSEMIPFKKSVDDSIKFLEGAGVQPAKLPD